MDARDKLRQYLEQRREMGESELVLDNMTVDEALRIVGAKSVGKKSVSVPVESSASASRGDVPVANDWRAALRDTGAAPSPRHPDTSAASKPSHPDATLSEAKGSGGPALGLCEQREARAGPPLRFAQDQDDKGSAAIRCCCPSNPRLLLSVKPVAKEARTT